MSASATSRNFILYADDDNDDLLFVKEAFEEQSLNVDLVTAKDGVETLSYLKKSISSNNIPCLIILDINMPKMDGKQTLLKLKEINELKHVPVILFSTSSQKTDKEFAQKHHAGFITKPIDYSQMGRIINTFFDHCNDDVKSSIKGKIIH